MSRQKVLSTEELHPILLRAFLYCQEDKTVLSPSPLLHLHLFFMTDLDARSEITTGSLLPSGLTCSASFTDSGLPSCFVCLVYLCWSDTDLQRHAIKERLQRVNIICAISCMHVTSTVQSAPDPFQKNRKRPYSSDIQWTCNAATGISVAHSFSAPNN